MVARKVLRSVVLMVESLVVEMVAVLEHRKAFSLVVKKVVVLVVSMVE